MDIEIRFHIILEKPTMGVDFGLQKGKGSNYETIQKQRSSSSDMQFEFQALAGTNKKGILDFSGPCVQGVAGARFVYVDIGACAGQTNSEWSRRLKIPLIGITSETIKKLMNDTQLVLEASVPGTGKDGGPNCATVKPFDGWKVKVL
jgi:hypothetical protein